MWSEPDTCNACGASCLLTRCEKDSGVCDACDSRNIERERVRGSDTTSRLRCGHCDSVLFTAEEEAARLCLGCLSSPGGNLP